MAARKKILAIFLVGLGLYIVSALITFSWKEDIPGAGVGIEERLSFLCKHPFGFPLKAMHWDMSCMVHQGILWAQLVNLASWMAAASLAYYLYEKYKKIHLVNSRVGTLKVVLLILLYLGSLVVIYFLAWAIFIIFPALLLRLLSHSDNAQRILIQTP